jgi:hypothetical protein
MRMRLLAVPMPFIVLSAEAWPRPRAAQAPAADAGAPRRCVGRRVARNLRQKALLALETKHAASADRDLTRARAASRFRRRKRRG